MKLKLNLTPKRFCFVLLAALAGSLLIGGGIYIWGVHQLNSRTTAWRTALAQSSVADDRLDQLVALKKQFKQYSTLAAELDTVLPRQKDESQFSLQLQALAAASGFNINVVSFPGSSTAPSSVSQTSPVGSVLALPVTIQGVGSFAAIQTFLQKIEQLGRFTNVSNLSISRAVDGRNLNSTITITTYVKP